MITKRKVIAEAETIKFGRVEVIKIEEVSVITSDDDLFNQYYDVRVDNDIRYRGCDARDTMLALCQYIDEISALD
jgi:hypothetical protein